MGNTNLKASDLDPDNFQGKYAGIISFGQFKIKEQQNLAANVHWQARSIDCADQTRGANIGLFTGKVQQNSDDSLMWNSTLIQ